MLWMEGKTVSSTGNNAVGEPWPSMLGALDSVPGTAKLIN